MFRKIPDAEIDAPEQENNVDTFKNSSKTKEITAKANAAGSSRLS